MTAQNSIQLEATAETESGLGTPLSRLLKIYEGEGFRLQTGLNSYHWRGWRDAPFTLLFKGEQLVETGGGGISIHEIPLFEHLQKAASFRRIFVIGNSFGFSTLLISLLWPHAQVRAVDCGFTRIDHWGTRVFHAMMKAISGDPDPHVPEPDFGINLTNRLAQQHGLNTRVIKGTSPQDVARILAEHFDGPPDLVFVDGYHAPGQVLLDYDAAAKCADAECVYLFHDVVNWKLSASFEQIRRESGLAGGILWRTASGMGLLYPSRANSRFQELVHAFTESDESLHRVGLRLRRRMLADQVMRLLMHNPVIDRVRNTLLRRKR